MIATVADKEWSKRSPLNMPMCYACEALTLPICGGGCSHNADLNKGSILGY